MSEEDEILGNKASWIASEACLMYPMMIQVLNSMDDEQLSELWWDLKPDVVMLINASTKLWIERIKLDLAITELDNTKELKDADDAQRYRDIKSTQDDLK